MHTGSVVESRVDDRVARVNGSVHTADETFYDSLQVLAALEMLGQTHQLSAFLHEDRIVAVDHDLGDIRVHNDLSEDSKTLYRLRHRVLQCLFLFKG